MSKPTNNNKRRDDYIRKEQYFMGLALLAAQRSKDPQRQVGATIVNEEGIVVGVGYNGMPIGCHDDEFPWGKDKKGTLENKHLYVCHAELNAIVMVNTGSCKGCTMYVTLFPCNECTKLLIQAGIKRIIYLSDDKHNRVEWQAARMMLRAAKVDFQPYSASTNTIVLDFSSKVPLDERLNNVTLD